MKTVHDVFLQDYEKKLTAKTMCANFRDLPQKQKETVRDYWAKVSSIFCKMCEAAPAIMGDITTHMPQATMDALSDAEEARVKDPLKFGLNTSKMFILTQMFIARLREKLWHRVKESGKSDPLEVFRFPVHAERVRY